tara:strand:+ start:949 stop:1383 length:435 start_codon:yes stop_codon:yes gene_type:complete
MSPSFNIKQFAIVVLLVSIWVNASEVFRYFLIVMPETRQFLSMVPDIAPMNWSVFLIWGVWDTVLTASIVFMFWLVAQVFGNNGRSVVVAGLASWIFFFVLFWVGLYNMSLSSLSLAAVALPLALLETIVASFIASRLYARASS